MSIHRIRLAGPWESRAISEDQLPTGESVRCQLPYTLSVLQQAFGVQLTRGFHHPTGTNDKTKLRIVLQASEIPVSVRINGTEIAECDGRINGEYLFDVTDQIDAFNELCVLMKSTQRDSAPTLNTVWLEIES